MNPSDVPAAEANAGVYNSPDELEQLMMIDDKENNARQGNTTADDSMLIDLCQQSNINLTSKETGQAVPITDGQQAFFALLLTDMSNLADYFYSKGYKTIETEDCIKTFYECSGDRKKLIQVLKNRKILYEIQEDRKTENK